MSKDMVVTLSHEDPELLAIVDAKTEALIVNGDLATFSQFLVGSASTGPSPAAKFIAALASVALGESIARIKARGEQEELHGDG